MSIIIDGTGSISGVSSNGGLSSAQTGSVIQVVNATTNTSTTNSTNAAADTTLTATITPKFATSKILVIVQQNGVSKQNSSTSVFLSLLRNGSSVINPWGNYVSDNGTSATNPTGVGVNYLDSPASTSALTYKTQFWSSANTALAQVQYGGTTSFITLMEIAG